MADNEMKIILSLQDNATKDLNKNLKDVDKTAQESTKNINSGFKQANQELRNFRQNLLIAGVAVAGIIGVTKEWANQNRATKEAFNSIDKSVKELTGFLGSIFAPTIIAISDLLRIVLDNLRKYFSVVQEWWSKLFSSISYGIQYAVAFFAAISNGSNVLEAHKIAVQTATNAVDQMGKRFNQAFTQDLAPADDAKNKLKQLAEEAANFKLLFEAGQMTSQDYYNSITTSQQQQIDYNNIIASQIEQLANLSSEVSNRQLMEAETRTAEQIGLLNFYKEEFAIAQRGMASLAMTVGKNIQTGLSDAISSVIVGAKTAKEAFAEFGQTLLKVIVDWLIQKAVAMVMEKAFEAAAIASAVATGSAIAAAYAPAALVANIASFGGAGAAAAATFGVASGALGVAMGAAKAFGGAKAMAFGGDEIVTQPTLFLAGEAGPERAIFQPLGRRGSGSSGTNISININNPTISSRDSIAELAEQLGFEIERSLRGARSLA